MSQDCPLPLDQAREPCPICGEPIVKGALKCIHCDSELTWRKYLTFSNTTLALVTALVAVVGSAAPAVTTLLTPGQSAMSAVFSGIDTDGETLSLLVSNKGRQTGALNRVGLAVDYNGTSSFEIYPQPKDNGAIFVDPGKTLGVRLLFAGSVCHWSSADAATDLDSMGSSVDDPKLAGSKSAVYVRFVNSDGQISNSKIELKQHSLIFPMFRKMKQARATCPP